jgi:hypothetical protein
MKRQDLKEGDMVYISHIYWHCELNNRYALYVGEKPSNDLTGAGLGQFWVCGDTKLTVIDMSLLACLRKVYFNKDDPAWT